MKKIFFSIPGICFLLTVIAQETVYPTPKHSGTTVITNATVHIGNG